MDPDIDIIDLKSIKLSYVGFVGYLTINTPKIIINKIYDRHYIDLNLYNIDDIYERQKLVNKINSEFELIEVNLDSLNNKELAKIARFINPDNTRWKKRRLLRSLHYLLKFKDDNYINSLTLDDLDEIQDMTNLKPESISDIILYLICNFYNIKLEFENDVNDMKLMLNYYMTLSENDMKDDILIMLDNETNAHSKQFLLPILTKLNKTTKYRDNGWLNSDADRIQFQRHVNRCLTLNKSPAKIRPKNPYYAIALAACFYQIDISFVRNPVLEYSALTREIYKPRDILMKQKMDNLNGKPYLSVTFNSNLPEDCYTKESLKRLLSKEGITNINGINMYQKLLDLKLMKTFHHGKICDSEFTNLNTVIDYSDVQNLEEYEVLTLVNKNSELSLENTAHTYKYYDLYLTFREYNKFLNPGETEEVYFSKDEISKLKYLCYTGINEGETEEHSLMREDLYNVIVEIQSGILDIPDSVSNLISKLNNNPEIIDLLYHILDMAMYMRSWKGEPHPYPVEIAERISQVEIDKNICKSFTELNLYKENMDLESYNCVLNLTLVKYKNGTYNIPNDTEAHGSTIQERLDIVLEITRDQSCIRMTANWLISTIYRCLKILDLVGEGNKVNFEISDLFHTV